MIRVLIVDDHAIVRRGLKEILACEPDFVVSETGDPTEAMSLIRAESWDLVVLDLDLPQKSGLDLLKNVKHERRDIPVLILSVYPEEQFALRTIEAGASGFVSKDSAPEDLVKAIRKLLKGEKYVSERMAERLLYRIATSVEAHPHDSLSAREFQILCLFGAGKAVSEIATELSLSAQTVSTYRARMLEKMGLRTTGELMRYAIQNGLAP
jgi:two-component system invasion response regulator UvrY